MGIQKGFLLWRFSPDGTTIASGLRDGTVQTLERQKLEKISTPIAVAGYAVAFSPDGKNACCAELDGY